MLLLNILLIANFQIVSDVGPKGDTSEPRPPSVHRERGPSPLELEIENIPRASGYENDLGFLKRYVPLMTNRNLDPAVDEHLVPFFLSGGCCCFGGSVWFPLLFMDTKTPDGYISDACLSWGLHIILQVGGLCALNILSFVFPPFSGLGGPGCVVLTLANAFYLMPVASINTYDRLVKLKQRRQRLKERQKAVPSRSKTKSQKESSTEHRSDAPAKPGAETSDDTPPSTTEGSEDEQSVNPPPGMMEDGPSANEDEAHQSDAMVAQRY